MGSQVSLLVDVQFACDVAGVPGEDEIRSWIQLAARNAKPLREGDCEVTVRVVDGAEIRALNRLYRQQDNVTNVLSFAAGEIDGLPRQEQRMLGDVVICAPIVNKEAAEQRKSVADHWGHILVHGALHLLGYDHVTDDEAAGMEALETRILAERGVADPYTVL